MAVEANPYNAPGVDLGLGLGNRSAPDDAREIREAHLSTEASIQSIAWIYGLSSVTLIGLGAFFAISGFAEDGASAFGLFALCAAIGVLMGWCGVGARRLDPRVRIPIALISGLSVLGSQGGLIHLYILYLVLCKKGRMVLSEDYEAVRAATPDMKYEMSMIVKIALVLLVGGLLALIGVGAMESLG